MSNRHAYIAHRANVIAEKASGSPAVAEALTQWGTTVWGQTAENPGVFMDESGQVIAHTMVYSVNGQPVRRLTRESVTALGTLSDSLRDARAALSARGVRFIEVTRRDVCTGPGPKRTN